MNFLIHLSGVNSKAKMLPMIEHNCSSNSSYCKLSNWYSYPISCSENIPIYYIYGSWNYILSAEYMCIHTHTMAPHSSTLAWKIPWMEEPGRLQSMGSLRVGHDWVTSLWLFTFMHWRRKWQPLQCTCLENPRDGGAWWAAVYGVAQSRTRLKWLSSSTSSSLDKEWE